MGSGSISLCVYEGSRLVRGPVLLTEGALRQVLLLASSYNETRVNFICARIDERGRCEMLGCLPTARFVLEKVVHS